ncbi:MAG: hypothetical protein HFE85_00120 [Clostridiales bacterium]|nr:hypothetical protein [Clostridiales bacterium]
MRVTFFGHSNTPQSVQKILQAVLTELIENDNADIFYVGNQGNFDCIVRKTLKQLNAVYPHIRYTVVLAYIPERYNQFDETNNLDTIVPDGLENTPRRYAISKRNRWMVKQADTIITYVTHNIGGAVKFKNFAGRQGKRVINLPDLSFF